MSVVVDAALLAQDDGTAIVDGRRIGGGGANGGAGDRDLGGRMLRRRFPKQHAVGIEDQSLLGDPNVAQARDPDLPFGKARRRPRVPHRRQSVLGNQLAADQAGRRGGERRGVDPKDHRVVGDGSERGRDRLRGGEGGTVGLGPIGRHDGVPITGVRPAIKSSISAR